LRDVVDEIP